MLTAAFLWAVLQTEESTEHYRVVFDGNDAAVAKSLCEALEKGYPKVLELLGIEPRERERYPVFLFETADAYKRKDQELNAGRFANNGAFSHKATGAAYVQLQPRPGVGLFDRMEAVTYHEAFHLVTYRHAAWVSGGPPWLYEGMAERAAELCMKREPTFKFSDVTNLVQALIARGGWISLGDLLSIDKSADADFLTRWTWYAEAWLLVKYLCEAHTEAWKKFTAAMAGSRDVGPARARALLLEATALEQDKLEEAWGEWIRGLKPAPWRLLDGDWRLTEDGLDGAAYEKIDALVVSAEPIDAERYTISVETRVAEIGRGQVDVLISAAWDLRGRNLIKASLVRDGVAAILVRKDGAWTRAAFARVEVKPAADRWMKLELEVEGRKVRLRADGSVLVEHEFDAAAPVELSEAYWGFGCHDSRVEFRAAKVDKR